MSLLRRRMCWQGDVQRRAARPWRALTSLASANPCSARNTRKRAWYAAVAAARVLSLSDPYANAHTLKSCTGTCAHNTILWIVALLPLSVFAAVSKHLGHLEKQGRRLHDMHHLCWKTVWWHSTPADVSNRKCAAEGCKRTPSFNDAGEEKGEYCSKHKLPDMVRRGLACCTSPLVDRLCPCSALSADYCMV